MARGRDRGYPYPTFRGDRKAGAPRDALPRAAGGVRRALPIALVGYRQLTRRPRIPLLHGPARGRSLIRSPSRDLALLR
jgi:hypothetical protein